MSQTVQMRTPAAESIRPPTSWYWAAGVLALVGVVAGAVIGFLGYLDAIDEFDAFPRFSAPGATEVMVEDPGALVIYYRGSPVPSLDALDLSVVGPSGSDVTVDQYGSVLIFETGQGQARAMASFHAVEAGPYRVMADGEAGGQLAVGQSWAWVVLPAVLGGLGIAALSVLAAIAIWLVTIIRRSRIGHGSVAPSSTPGRLD